jgi:hypothetical protein
VTRFAYGRTAVCAVVGWSGYVVAWEAASGARPAIALLWWLAGLTLFQAIRSSLPERPAADPIPPPTPVSADAVQDWESEGGAVVTG